MYIWNSFISLSLSRQPVQFLSVQSQCRSTWSDNGLMRFQPSTHHTWNWKYRRGNQQEQQFLSLAWKGLGPLSIRLTVYSSFSSTSLCLSYLSIPKMIHKSHPQEFVSTGEQRRWWHCVHLQLYYFIKFRYLPDPEIRRLPLSHSWRPKEEYLSGRLSSWMKI